MPEQFMILLFAALGLLALAAISLKSGQGSLDGIKAKPVGDGQHGTALWATPKEIGQTFAHVLFRPSEWRQGKNLPKAQGLVLGSQGKKGKIVALVDSDDIHCLMIGASGAGQGRKVRKDSFQDHYQPGGQFRPRTKCVFLRLR